MAQFSVNIPNTKVQSFLTSMAQFGFTQSIQNLQFAQINQQQMHQQEIKNHSQHHHPYFDWDFYFNDILID